MSNEVMMPVGGTSDAATCRSEGWGVGTLLAGDSGCGETVIVVTAIGEEAILARPVSRKGVRYAHPQREGHWVLCYRDWYEVSAEYLASLPAGGG